MQGLNASRAGPALIAVKLQFFHQQCAVNAFAIMSKPIFSNQCPAHL
jgi:hypothetical protein